MRLRSNIKKVISLLDSKINEARIEATEEIGDLAQSEAPVLTGQLRDSKKTEHQEDVSFVGFTAPHAPFVEFGSEKTSYSGNPFFSRVGLGQGKQILTKKLKEKLNDVK